VIIPIHKKADKEERTKYRCVSLRILPGKAYAKCLEERFREINTPKVEDTQCSFCPGRSTTDQIFEKSCECAKDICACCVDIEKAYDQVPKS